MRLLVAENDPALATFLHNRSDAEHYAVNLTRNSEQARQMVQERSYGLANLDMNLTVSNGEGDKDNQAFHYQVTRSRRIGSLHRDMGV